MCSQINKEDPCLNCAFPDLPASRKGPVPVWGQQQVLRE